MIDVLTPLQRKYNMSRIRGKDTKPEITLRKALWLKGLRYRIKNKLPGRPDVVFPRYKVAIFIDGCYWHRCPKHYKEPETNKIFWEAKISGNVKRDIVNTKKLKKMKWRVIRVWEHQVNKDLEKVVEKIRKICLSSN